MNSWFKAIIICSIFGFIVGLTMGNVLGVSEQAIQQTNKIFLNPFYRESMSQNTNYTYTLIVNPPDKISNIATAIINFDVWITPTVSFALWVNGQSCNNPSYLIHTTYADTGRGVVTFDCSNRITKAGTYTIHLRPTQANTGASTAWADVTYSNKPLASIQLHGTEYMYNSNSTAKLWLQLLNSSGSYVTNAACFVDVYTPAMTQLIERAEMINYQHDGIFYYDIQIPEEEGVYPVIAICYYYISPGVSSVYFNNYFNYTGTYESGTMADTQTIDGTFIRFKETTTVPRNIMVGFNITNQKVCWNISESLLAGASISLKARFDSVANDDLTIYFWNYTSSTFQALPNKFTEGTGWQTVSNSFLFDNISTTGFVNSTGSGLTLMINDTGLTDGASNNFDIDYLSFNCDTFTDPDWQETKGSSEIHVSNIPGKVWDFRDRNLTFYQDVTNYDNISKIVWNYPFRNLTYINWSKINDVFNYSRLEINYTYLSEQIWFWSGSVSASIKALFADTIWNYSPRNITYFPDVYNYSMAAEQCWAYPNRTLSQFGFNINTTASINVSEIWMYPARYTHGEIVT